MENQINERTSLVDVNERTEFKLTEEFIRSIHIYDPKKEKRRNDLFPENLPFIPSVIIEDPKFCFRFMIEQSESNFIDSLSQKDWEEIQNDDDYFEGMKNLILNVIFDKFSSRFIEFDKLDESLVK